MTPSTDRDVLLGELAVLTGFLCRETLQIALKECESNKTTSLRQTLLEQRILRAEELDALELLAEQYRRRQGEVISLVTQPTGAYDTLLPHAAAAAVRPIMTGLRFRPLRPHAKGGLGEVFVALDGELNREVALKEIRAQHADNADSRARFLLEAEVTGKLEHPGVVPVYGLGTYEDGRPYYAMRFIKGQSLQDAVLAFHADKELKANPGKRSLELRQLLSRFVAVCNTLAYAHSKGVLHRDLKPDNVMLGNYGETLVVDWGLAKSIGAREEPTTGGSVMLRLSSSGLTLVGSVLGTPQYMSPEQAAGQQEGLGPASDVYGLGATLYHLLTGKPPFPAGNVCAVLDAVSRGAFPPPRQVDATVPAALEAVCLKAMHLDPQHRYASAQELADDVEHWLADEPVTACVEPVWLRLARWRHRHPALAAGAAALVFSIVAALGVGALLLSHEQGRTLQAERAKVKEQEGRALAQVNALLNANPQAVPSILEGLAPFHEQLRPRLLEERDRPAPRDATPAARRRWQQHRTRAALALLADGPNDRDFLTQRLLAEDVEPNEMLLIRNVLPVTEELTRRMWAEVDRRGPKDPGRFRALVALARFDPDNPRWEQAGAEAVGPLLAAEPLHVGVWSVGLRGVSASLREPLTRVYRDHSRPVEARLAAGVLRDYEAQRPEVLADLLADADAQQFPLMLAVLRPHGEEAIALLHKELDRRAGPDWQERPLEAEKSAVTEKARDRAGQRWANVAAALLHLGRPERAWSLLRQSIYPDARTYLLHRSGPLGVDVRLLLRQLEVETDAAARQALILALGEYTAEQVPADVRKRWTARLLDWYRGDPDPGVHAAIDWLLRHGKDGPLSRKLDWGQAKELGRLDKDLEGKSPEGGRRWYVNGQGQTMVLLGPGEFLMGSPLREANRFDNELPHRRWIGRRFALASKKVTVAQFQRFKKDNPKVKHQYTERFSPDPDGPVISVTWYEAAQYCNWLSEQEGIPPEQWCYPSIADIEKHKVDGKPLRLPDDYLSRAGYRLPTEAEWEYACRAGAVSSRYYGSSLEMLGQHAWYQQNVEDRTWPVGQKKPNSFGLFDMHGNTWDWCQEGYAEYRVGERGKPTPDEEDKREVTDQLNRVLRGGSFYSQATGVRSAFRLSYKPSARVFFIGFGLRVARTYH
jgi:formylglycine-generating enzyme required for sulfatase activity/tRNA A-37 threonylcarbamoyl transferase component Bud32